ncbi:MAG: class I SAM-dependent methyltransferase [Streptosporangiaceae bacterium]|nr:class I SAM-dependent methyltransferase [Streptosporangiaceae bacterium]
MPDATEFDAWHGDVASSSLVNSLFQRALGLPPGFDSNSLLTWSGISEVAAALRLSAGQTLVDLACGRGAYGMEVARRTGARLAGFDFAPSAVAIALRNAVSRDLAGRAWFGVDDYTAVAMRDHCADAVMCIDAVQFSEPPLAALREFRRILVAGGRLAVTAWEPIEPVDDRLPERMRRMNLSRDLREAGFSHVEVTEKPDWYAAERTLWESALEAENADGDPALVSLQKEGARALETFAVKRRVLATATA